MQFLRKIKANSIKRKLQAVDTQNKVDSVREQNLTYVSDKKFLNLLSSLAEVEREKVDGIIIEAGCALGGSAIVLASQMGAQRTFQVYDVFDTIPAPGEKDPEEVHLRYEAISKGEAQGINGDEYYGYMDGIKARVAKNIAHNLPPETAERITLIEGLVQDTLLLDGPVAFAHIDVDWYEPVLTCLERIYPKLSPGGVIILDDYFDWGGCKDATDHFLKSVAGTYKTDASRGNFRIIKTAP